MLLNKQEKCCLSIKVNSWKPFTVQTLAFMLKNRKKLLLEDIKKLGN